MEEGPKLCRNPGESFANFHVTLVAVLPLALYGHEGKVNVNYLFQSKVLVKISYLMGLF